MSRTRREKVARLGPWAQEWLQDELRDLYAIADAAKRFVDMVNEWKHDAPEDISLPMPIDYNGSALGAALDAWEAGQ